MLRLLFYKSFIGLSILINYVYAQGWTEPVNVSQMGKFCNAPKMTVDHNGAIHAVWSMMVTQQYRKIMYARSEDMGNTWTTPVAIADDSLQWFAQPGIACDLLNHLYVAFEGDAMSPSTSLIYLVKYNGTQWSEPIVISPGFPGSMHTRMIADHTGRIYCFWSGWFLNNSRILYRYYENSTWSDILIPYSAPDESCFLTNLVVDKSNNLHCVGHHHLDYQPSNHEDVNYFSYYRSSNQWSPFEVISDTLFDKFIGRDIDLDSTQVPHFTWSQFIHPTPSSDKATLYRYPNYSGWLPVDSVELNHNSHDHQLVIDRNNRSNIIVNSWVTSPSLFSYLLNYRLYGDEWIGEIIDSINGVFYEPNADILNINQIGVIYFKGRISTDTISDIYFSKFDIYTDIKYNNRSTFEFSIFPNPFEIQADIIYTIETTCHVVLDIIDMNGKHIARLNDRTESPGKYCYTWQGTDSKRKEVGNGLYFVRLQAGRYVLNCKLIKIK